MIAAPRGRRTDRTMDTGLWVMMAVIITGVALALTASPGTRALPSGVVLTGWPGMAAMLAAGGSLSVLLGSYLMFREARTARLRAARMVRDGAALAASFDALEAVKSRAEAQIAQLQAVLGGMSDGVMMVDDDLRLVAWNTRYGLLNGVPQEVLRVGVALSEVIRAQARAGEFGKLDGADGIESEVKRRTPRLRQTRF